MDTDNMGFVPQADPAAGQSYAYPYEPSGIPPQPDWTQNTSYPGADTNQMASWLAFDATNPAAVPEMNSAAVQQSQPVTASNPLPETNNDVNKKTEKEAKKRQKAMAKEQRRMQKQQEKQNRRLAKEIQNNPPEMHQDKEQLGYNRLYMTELVSVTAIVLAAVLVIAGVIGICVYAHFNGGLTAAKGVL